MEYENTSQELYSKVKTWMDLNFPKTKTKKKISSREDLNLIKQDSLTLRSQLHSKNYNDPLVKRILQIRQQIREKGEDDYNSRKVSEFSQKTRLFLRSLEHGQVSFEEYEKMTQWLNNRFGSR